MSESEASSRGADEASSESGGASESGDSTRQTDDPRRAVVEWTTLGISLAILAALVGALTYAQLFTGPAEPQIEVTAETGQTRQVSGVYHVPVRISNRGRAARDVQIRVTLAPATASASTTAESVDLRFDIVPTGASKSGTAVFRSDPSRATVTAQLISFSPP